MDLQHLNVKLYAAGNPHLDLEPAIPMFHRWIQEQVFQPQLLLDVADYRHVFQGPSIVLVAAECDYVLDQTGGRLGLLYNQKAPLPGGNQDRLRAVFASALRAALALEAEEIGQAGFKFDGREWDVIVNDRALIPNTAESFSAAKKDLESFFKEALGDNSVSLTHHADPRERFRVTVTAAKPVEWSQAFKKRL